MKKITPLLSILIIATTIYWSFSDMMPSKNQPETNAPTSFSLKNALNHVKNIAQKPHFVGSEAHQQVQNYLVNELKKLGLQPKVNHQIAMNQKWRAATNTANIIATIKGTENGKALLLLSHYDSSPHSSLGASDDGAGVATILEGLRAFLAQNKPPKNDIIILFSDAEELGLLGAEAFVQNNPLAKNVGLVLNFEARGSGGPSYMLMETNRKNSKLLSQFLKSEPNYPVANSLMYSIYKMLPNDTDLTVFRQEANINGFNFAFIDDHFDYHTAQDTYKRLDRKTLLHQADYLMTTLPYFANAKLNDLNSTTDNVYTNFPFVNLLHYPFSWTNYLLIGAVIWLLLLLFFGISLNKITIKGLLKGFIPFILGLLICGGGSYFLWKGILFIFPQYNDILHGFTYNGYFYIAAFVCLNLWVIFRLYKPYFKKYLGTDLLIAPLVIWLIINTLTAIYLPGAGYFIIPVYFALFILTLHVFLNLKKTVQIILFTFLSIPVLYVFGPQVKMFPVGLGLKNLFISAFFIMLIFGLLAPIFGNYKSRKVLVRILGIATLFFFGYTSYFSRFNNEHKKPNSLVFVQDNTTNQSYWATYNKVLDNYTESMLGKNPTRGTFMKSTSKSKYNSAFTYYKKTQNKKIPTSIIKKIKDTIIGNERDIALRFTPQRSINKLELLANNPVSFNSLSINGIVLKSSNNKKPILKINGGTILSYYLTKGEPEIHIEFTIPKDLYLNISSVESSFDLLTNPLFSVPKRTQKMMPMPFVTNDAIITVEPLNF